MYNTLKTLCMTSAVSGREKPIRDLLREKIAPYADEVTVDNLGNLIALRRGNAPDRKKIMLCAHMDEIGFLVTVIEESGALRVSAVGGIHWHASAYSNVISERGVQGVLIPEAQAKPADFAADSFVIDIGAKNKKEAARRVSIGDFFVCEPSLHRLCGKRVCGRPLDDRIGCAVILQIAKEFENKTPKHDLYYVFSVQEEVGCRGAKPASFAIAPDYALVFDVTGTGDSMGAKPMACKLSDGAAIKIKDSSVICHDEVVQTLQRLAKEHKIAHQTEILTYGGTDTSSIQMSGYGSRVGALSIPTRYIHSGVEMLDLSDAEACTALATAFCESL